MASNGSITKNITGMAGINNFHGGRPLARTYPKRIKAAGYKNWPDIPVINPSGTEQTYTITRNASHRTRSYAEDAENIQYPAMTIITHRIHPNSSTVKMNVTGKNHPITTKKINASGVYRTVFSRKRRLSTFQRMAGSNRKIRRDGIQTPQYRPIPPATIILHAKGRF